MKTIRIDDISLNTNFLNLRKILDLFINKFIDVKFVLGVSPLIFDMSENDGIKRERIFPSILNAFSDHKLFYRVQKCGVPHELYDIINDYKEFVQLAGHGIIHIDHRLLSYEVQELSIIASCSLVESSIFIPPFNKWNKYTENICFENKIVLVKFEDDWVHLLYNKDALTSNKLYFHTHDITFSDLKKLIS